MRIESCLGMILGVVGGVSASLAAQGTPSPCRGVLMNHSRVAECKEGSTITCNDQPCCQYQYQPLNWTTCENIGTDTEKKPGGTSLKKVKYRQFICDSSVTPNVCKYLGEFDSDISVSESICVTCP